MRLEGTPEIDRLVIMEFPTLDAAKGFYHSPEYQQAKAVRAGAGIAEFVAMQGV